MKKYLKLLLALLVTAALLCGCGPSVTVTGYVDQEETVPETTVNSNPFWTVVETEPQDGEASVEYPYDYTMRSFFEMTNCWDYAPEAIAYGVLDGGMPFFLQQQDGHHVAQGACTDGTYGYFYMAKPGDPELQYIFKVDLSTWEIVQRSEELDIQHANGACYNPNTHQLISVNMSPDGKDLTIVDADTLKPVGKVSVYTNVSAIAYCAERDQYVVRLTGTKAFDYAVLDSSFQLVAEYPGVNSLLGIQNIACDENYIYRLDSGCVKKPGTEGVIVYDWEGNYQGVYRIVLDVNGTAVNREVGETEALFIYNGEFYLSILAGSGGNFYRLDMDLDELYW